MPDEVENTMPARCKRIPLEGQAGFEWYLGEQMAMQSLGNKEPRVPKTPLGTMLSNYTLTKESEVKDALNEYPASEWLAKSSDYAKYRDEYVRYQHCEDFREAKRQPRNLEGAIIRVGNIAPHAWSV
ncbi:hypothetical protein GBA52_014869 [Prunus armeniaca]|nr:hypothetical protein GBA52_014869 [Prunus armeniaca]